MGLGLKISSGGGDFLPIVKYDARAGRMFRVDKVDGISTPVDITKKFKAVFDFENVEVGYINFATGSAPDFVMVPLGARGTDSETAPQRRSQGAVEARHLVDLRVDKRPDGTQIVVTGDGKIGAPGEYRSGHQQAHLVEVCGKREFPSNAPYAQTEQNTVLQCEHRNARPDRACRDKSSAENAP